MTLDTTPVSSEPVLPQYTLCKCVRSDMWQSQIEIEHYSVAYFGRITVFEAL